jgi:hypothetical protein
VRLALRTRCIRGIPWAGQSPHSRRKPIESDDWHCSGDSFSDVIRSHLITGGLTIAASRPHTLRARRRANRRRRALSQQSAALHDAWREYAATAVRPYAWKTFSLYTRRQLMQSGTGP